MRLTTSRNTVSSRWARSTFSDLRAFPSGAERGRGLQRKRLEQPLVLGVESALPLVEGLRDADDLALLVADRDAQDVPRAVAALGVELPVEALVGIGVGDDFGLALGEDGAGD